MSLARRRCRYRVGKLARKHKAGVAGAPAVALALVFGLAGTTYGFVRAATSAIAAIAARQAELQAAPAGRSCRARTQAPAGGRAADRFARGGARRWSTRLSRCLTWWCRRCGNRSMTPRAPKGQAASRRRAAWRRLAAIAGADRLPDRPGTNGPVRGIEQCHRRVAAGGARRDRKNLQTHESESFNSPAAFIRDAASLSRYTVTLLSLHSSRGVDIMLQSRDDRIRDEPRSSAPSPPGTATSAARSITPAPPRTPTRAAACARHSARWTRQAFRPTTVRPSPSCWPTFTPMPPMPPPTAPPGWALRKWGAVLPEIAAVEPPGAGAELVHQQRRHDVPQAAVVHLVSGPRSLSAERAEQAVRTEAAGLLDLRLRNVHRRFSGFRQRPRRSPRQSGCWSGPGRTRESARPATAPCSGRA